MEFVVVPTARNERIHLRQNVVFAIKHANASRTKHLMARESQEIDVEVFDVRLHMRDGLRPIKANKSPMRMGDARQFFHGLFVSQDVANRGERNQFR